MIAPHDPGRPGRPGQSGSDGPQENPPADPFADVPVIFSYTREQAIADGVLIDLTEWAKETGFVVPVACTAAVWHDHIVPPRQTQQLGQSERGRGHDLLWVLRTAIRRADRQTEQLRFSVLFVTGPDRQQTVQLKAICGPGDQGEPVITILQLHED